MNGLILAIACYAVTGDQLAYCQAREHNEVSFCYNIHDPALRQSCRSELQQTPWACDGITDFNARQECRARSTKK